MRGVSKGHLSRNWAAAKKDGKEDQMISDLSEAIQKNELTPNDFSIRELFEVFVDDGREIVDSWNPRHGGDGVSLMEASNVNTGVFQNVSGQLLVNKTMERFNDPEFLYPKLAETVQTNLDGEKIPGVTDIGDEAEAIDEGFAYPYAGVTEDWVETPQTVKRGFIIALTKEVVFFDKTGQLLERSGNVGYWLGVNKEKRVLDVALGLTNNYRRKGVAADTYIDGGAQYDNIQASNALVDWTDVENALLLFDGMTDEATGEPVSIQPTQMIVPTALLMTARRIVNATEIRFGKHGDTSASTVGVSGNPLSSVPLEILSNPFVKQRTSSATSWYIGDYKRALKYMQNWDITVVQAPPNSNDEFHRDIVNQWKVSERGVPVIVEPRYVVKSTG